MRLCLAITLLLWLPASLRAETPQRELQPGSQAVHYFSAHFSTGVWKESSKKFICPVINEVQRTKVAIFAKEANPQTLQLAVALDKVMQEFPQISWSFFLVGEKASDKSMTDDELASRLEELRQFAESNDIKKLSMAHLQRTTKVTRWRNTIDCFGDADIFLAVIEPGISPPPKHKSTIRKRWLPTRKVKPFYRYTKKLTTAEIDRATAEAIIQQALLSLVNQ